MTRPPKLQILRTQPRAFLLHGRRGRLRLRETALDVLHLDSGAFAVLDRGCRGGRRGPIGARDGRRQHRRRHDDETHQSRTGGEHDEAPPGRRPSARDVGDGALDRTKLADAGARRAHRFTCRACRREAGLPKRNVCLRLRSMNAALGSLARTEVRAPAGPRPAGAGPCGNGGSGTGETLLALPCRPRSSARARRRNDGGVTASWRDRCSRARSAPRASPRAPAWRPRDWR